MNVYVLFTISIFLDEVTHAFQYFVYAFVFSSYDCLYMSWQPIGCSTPESDIPFHHYDATHESMAN